MEPIAPQVTAQPGPTTVLAQQYSSDLLLSLQGSRRPGHRVARALLRQAQRRLF